MAYKLAERLTAGRMAATVANGSHSTRCEPMRFTTSTGHGFEVVLQAI